MPNVIRRPTPAGGARGGHAARRRIPTGTRPRADVGTITTCYYNAVIATAPVSYWRLGTATGTTYPDSTGTNPGERNGSPTPVAGALADGDLALQFNAVTDYVLVTDAAPLDVGNAPWSLVFLLRYTSGTSNYAISKGNQFNVRVVSNNIALDNDDVGIAFQSQTAVTDAAWHHYAIVRYATGSGNTEMWLDGSRMSLTETNPTLAFTANAINLNLGRYSGGVVGLTGALDEVALYNRAVTQDEIVTLYGSLPLQCFDPVNLGLQAFYDLTDDLTES